MAQINAPRGANTKRTIVGRGYASKGRCCGRGNNGQNARSGGGVRPGFEGGQMPLYRRVARRGFSNFPFKQTYVAISLTQLDNAFSANDNVNDTTLREKGVIKGIATQAKILANGKISKALTIDGVKISSSAQALVEKAGGKVNPVKKVEYPAKGVKKASKAAKEN